MVSAWIGASAFFVVVLLYIFLAMGLPLGAFAMGGKYRVLPKPLRRACAFSVFIQLTAILFILQAGHIISIRRMDTTAVAGCFIFGAYLLLNTVMNGLSKSMQEKIIMTPLSLITAACFFITAWNS